MGRPVPAIVLTFVGGLFVILGGVFVAALGTVLALLGHSSIIFYLGLLDGLLLLAVAGLMAAVPRAHVVWGVLAIVLSVASLVVALGGFVVGFLLALIGGLLAIAWRPSKAAFVTVGARVVPPPPPT
ncbi:MAG TPA: DUF6114 domain-containing protein [Thermoplasmata archaeon]|nr:DUF6114 domain-containing protein [Thermoplasmata archaeon]